MWYFIVVVYFIVVLSVHIVCMLHSLYELCIYINNEFKDLKNLFEVFTLKPSNF